VFSWDAAKAIRNRKKHGVGFDEAASVFADPRAVLVVYTIRRLKNAKESIRIISARQASRKERKAYAGQPD
jgi:uncharacterized DUF497 family protein